jgi:aspartyl-tRNA(Asn)/glutamyl-tRNA(Gln) amidotransferase subunit A
MSELLDLDLVDIARAIRERQTSSLEVTTAMFEALEGRGRELNAVALLFHDTALEQAKRADEALARGETHGPLHGVPLAHKDMFYRAGRTCASGSRARADFVPDETAFVVSKLDEAGAIDAGRLNMVEFALGLTGHNAITGHPKNPYNKAHLTGGSSSGPAASLAARLNFATLGSDTGGSIRVPASACGLVGIKPTYGRVSRSGGLPLSFTLDHVGPLARTTRDLALMLQLIAGHDPDDATSSRRDVPDYMAGLDGHIEGVRVGVAKGPLEQPIDPEIDRLMSTSVMQLDELGAEIVEVALPPLEELNALRRVIMYTEVATLHRRLIETNEADYNPQTLARMRPGFFVDAIDYLESIAVRAQKLREFVAAVFADIDVLHLPVLPSPMPGIAETDMGGRQDLVDLVNALGAFVCPFNYLGLPAMSVPVGITGNGVPTGMQLIGRPFAEGLLLRVSQVYESATGFSSRRPTT